MSPEQAVGERELDGRSDIYSLGLVAYEMFAGSAPFTGSSPMAVLTKQLTEAPPPLALRRPDLPAEITGAIDRALSKQPGDRWATAEEFARAITGASASDPSLAAPVRSPSAIPAARVSTMVTPAASSAPRRSRGGGAVWRPRVVVLIVAGAALCAARRVARRAASIHASRSSSRRSRSSAAAISSPGCARAARACSRSTSRSGRT